MVKRLAFIVAGWAFLMLGVAAPVPAHPSRRAASGCWIIDSFRGIRLGAPLDDHFASSFSRDPEETPGIPCPA